MISSKQMESHINLPLAALCRIILVSTGAAWLPVPELLSRSGLVATHSENRKTL